MKPKENEFAFVGDRKESFRDRLEKLIGKRSVRAAAKDWGLPTSTINNYLHKGTEPALRVVMTIAEAETVSLEWLAAGLNKNLIAKNSPTESSNENEIVRSDVERKLFEQLSFLTEREKQKLVEVFARKGVETILHVLDDNNIKLLQLPDVIKEQILAIHTPGTDAVDLEARECGADNEKQEGQGDPASQHRQAS